MPSSHDFDFYTADNFNKFNILEMEQTILKTLDYKLFHFNDTTGESDDTNIVCLDEIHPFGQYLWEMLQVGCLDWHSLNYKQVWYVALQL